MRGKLQDERESPHWIIKFKCIRLREETKVRVTTSIWVKNLLNDSYSWALKRLCHIS